MQYRGNINNNNDKIFILDDFDERPDVLIVFILSHGRSGGIVLTDKFDTIDARTGLPVFETYTYDEINSNLAGLDYFANSLKILFIGVSTFLTFSNHNNESL
jgi:hypothetical protein